MIRYKEVKLTPTLFDLDVFIVSDRYNHNAITKSDRKSLSKILHIKYGGNYEYWFENSETINEVFTTRSHKKSYFKGELRIVLIINPSIKVLVHEVIHILWNLAKATSLDMNYDSQEWQAIMYEYIFTEIKEFKKIPIFTTK